MIDPVTQARDFDDFVEKLYSITWLGSLGKPIDYPHVITCGEDWRGPEDPCVEPIGAWQGELYKELVTWDLSDDFGRVSSLVRKAAREFVPYDDDADPWYWANAAVWHTEWTAALVGIHIKLRRKLPTDLLTQWKWSVAERWPCALVEIGYEVEAYPRLVEYFEDFPSKFVIF